MGLLIVSLIMVALKKTQFVESHELGCADTLLQIGITWSLSLSVIFVTRYLKRIKCAKRAVLIVGSISYELYLAHVLPLDWLKQQVTIRNFMVYGIVFILSTLIIYLDNYFVLRIGKSVMREKT